MYRSRWSVTVAVCGLLAGAARAQSQPVSAAAAQSQPASAASAQSQAAEWGVAELRFVDEDIPEGKFYALTGPVQGLALYKVEFVVANSGYPVSSWAERPGSPRQPPQLADLAQTAGGHELSKVQSLLMGDPPWLHVWGTGTLAIVDFYAASEEDARAVARALVELANAKRRESLEQLRATVQNLDADLAAMAAELEAAEQRDRKHEAMMKDLYEKLGDYPERKQAELERDELNRVMRDVAIEIAGIKAKLTAIAKARSEGRAADDTTRAMLDRMQLEEDISLAGALARQSAADERLALVRRYLENVGRESVANATRELIANRRKSAEMAAARLQAMPADLRPVEVYSNRVRIHRIQRP
jgi:hypothetical protein